MVFLPRFLNVNDENEISKILIKYDKKRIKKINETNKIWNQKFLKDNLSKIKKRFISIKQVKSELLS